MIDTDSMAAYLNNINSVGKKVKEQRRQVEQTVRGLWVLLATGIVWVAINLLLPLPSGWANDPEVFRQRWNSYSQGQYHITIFENDSMGSFSGKMRNAKNRVSALLEGDDASTYQVASYDQSVADEVCVSALRAAANLSRNRAVSMLSAALKDGNRHMAEDGGSTFGSYAKGRLQLKIIWERGAAYDGSEQHLDCTIHMR